MIIIILSRGGEPYSSSNLRLNLLGAGLPFKKAQVYEKEICHV
jgi:hypothetical protein